MRRPRLDPIRETLTASAVLGAITLSVSNAFGAGSWRPNRLDLAAIHHVVRTDGYAESCGQGNIDIGPLVWRYGDGSFDRSSKALSTIRASAEAPFEAHRISAYLDLPTTPFESSESEVIL